MLEQNWHSEEVQSYKILILSSFKISELKLDIFKC